VWRSWLTATSERSPEGRTASRWVFSFTAIIVLLAASLLPAVVRLEQAGQFAAALISVAQFLHPLSARAESNCQQEKYLDELGQKGAALSCAEGQ